MAAKRPKNTQQPTEFGVGRGRDIGEGARPRRNVWGGCFGCVWGAELSGKYKQQLKYNEALDGPQNDLKTHINQTKMSIRDGRDVIG